MKPRLHSKRKKKTNEVSRSEETHESNPSHRDANPNFRSNKNSDNRHSGRRIVLVLFLGTFLIIDCSLSSDIMKFPISSATANACCAAAAFQGGMISSGFIQRQQHRVFSRVKQRPLFQTSNLIKHQQKILIQTRCNLSNDSRINQNVKQSPEEKYQQLMSATPLSLAPMMEYTNRHFRHLVRLLSQKTLLYTEMVAANAIVEIRREALEEQQLPNDDNVNGSTNNSHSRTKQKQHKRSDTLYDQIHQDLEQFGYDMTYLRRYVQQCQTAPEGPSVLQLGGSDPQTLSQACATVMELTSRGYCDYTALNLNCGCPSPKVAGKGCFGAALMNDAKLVKEVVKGMSDGCNGELPVTVKCRIGTDEGYTFTKRGYTEEISDEDEYSNLCRFIETVASSGVVTDFQVHARIAVLSKSFSPADNRNIPPLKYDMVRRLVEDYPELTFSLNGGIDTLSGAKNELEACPGLKGVMIGRAWAANPWSFAMTDEILYGGGHNNGELWRPNNRLEVLREFGKHADQEEELWEPIKIRRFMTKAISTLFTGEPNAKKYRIALDDIANRPKEIAAQGGTLEGQPPLSELIINAAVEHLSEEVLLRTPQESYEILLQGEKKKATAVTGNDSINADGEMRSRVVQEWQELRKEGDDRTQGTAL